MKTPNYYIALAAACLLISCSNEKPAKHTARVKEKKLGYALSPDSIYRTGSINKALALASPLQKAESRKLFMNGLDLLANKNNPSASVEYFKEAICYYPDEKNYTHLFEAYIRNNQPNLADSVNDLLDGKIEFMEGSFNKALIAAVKRDADACISGLDEALRQGFPFKDRIVNEKLFDFIKEEQSYESLIITYFGNDEKMRRTLFKAFVNSFPEIRLPYEQTSDSAAAFNFDKYINYDFAMFVPGMEDGRFSRDVSREFMMVGKFNTDNGVAIIYKSYEMIADTLNPVETNIVLYDSTGTLVSNQSIACYCSPLESRGFVVNTDKTIVVTSYSTRWENDPVENGYAGNKIVSVGPTGKQKFQITKENRLTELDNKDAVASSGK